eukprot:scaffold4993_cov73-Skeletonema_dohrnii-CCMP3373.AAC.1
MMVLSSPCFWNNWDNSLMGEHQRPVGERHALSTIHALETLSSNADEFAECNSLNETKDTMPSIIPSSTAALPAGNVGLSTKDAADAKVRQFEPEKDASKSKAVCSELDDDTSSDFGCYTAEHLSPAVDNDGNYNDDHDDDDNNHGDYFTGGSSSPSSNSNSHGDEGFPVSSTSSAEASPSSSFSTPGAGWANQSSSCRGEECHDNECNSRASTNDIDGATHSSSSSHGTKIPSPSTNVDNDHDTYQSNGIDTEDSYNHESSNNKTPNIIEDLCDRIPELRVIVEKLKELCKKYGVRYVPFATHATTLEDIILGTAMNFPPGEESRENFIAELGLLTLGDDGLPLARCQNTIFKKLVLTLKEHFDMTEEDAKEYVLKHTIVFNRLCSDGPSDWSTDSEKRPQYEAFCRESDPLVKELVQGLVKEIPNLRA